jgi:NhaA family Na+:H+ antiporter
MIRRVRSATRDFLHSEAAGGIVLMAAAACAMLVANLPGLSRTISTCSISRPAR